MVGLESRHASICASSWRRSLIALISSPTCDPRKHYAATLDAQEIESPQNARQLARSFAVAPRPAQQLGTQEELPCRSTKEAIPASAMRRQALVSLLVTPGGGLNSSVSNWSTAVFNAMEVFRNDFRCITMDQRNANSGEFDRPRASR